MQLEIKLFGITKDIIGSDALALDWKEEVLTAEDLLQYLKSTYPALEEIPSCLMAVNRNYASLDTVIQDHDEIALIPPVSGG
jgi:molybdopterin converting factor subunit 1